MIKFNLARAASAILLAAAVLSVLPAQADSWGLPQLMAALAQVPARDSRYTEKKTLALFKAPVESSGTLSYRRPDHVEKHVLRPKDEAISVDGDQLTWTGANGRKRSLRLQDNAVAAALVGSIRATLAGDLPSLQRYFAVSLEGPQTHWTLALTPTDKALRSSVQAMRIEGDGDRVASIEVLESGGDRSLMLIENEEGLRTGE